MTSLRISTATASDLPIAADILAEAFEHDPVMLQILRGPRRRVRLAHLFLGMMLSAPPHECAVDIARLDEGGEIVGAASWSTADPHDFSIRPLLAQLPHFARGLGLRGIPNALSRLRTLDSQRPTAPHWYLAELGVRRAHQGHGVGSALLRHRLSQIDDEGGTAYLESSTPDNRRLYERFGFHEKGPLAGWPQPAPMRMLRPSRRPE